MDDEQLLRIFEAHLANGASEEEAMRAVNIAAGLGPDGAPSTGDPDQEAALLRRNARGGSGTGDFLRMAAQGATFGFADEIAGAAAGMAPGGRTRDEATEASRSRIEDLRTLNPGASALSELAGGAAVPVGAGGAAMRSGGGVLKSALAGAAVGGLQGGAYGVGEGEGSLAERAPGAVDDALIGATLGGVLGVAPTIVNAAVRGSGGRGERLAGAVRKTTGVEEDLLQARNRGDEMVRAAGDRYEPLEQANQAIRDPDVLRLLTSDAYKKAVERVEPEGFGLTTRTASGQFGPGRLPSAAQLRSVRRSTRGLLDKAIRDGDSFEIDRLTKLYDQLDTAVEGAVPGLADVDRGYASAKGFREGVDTGFKSSNKAASDLAYEMQDMHPSQVEGTRTGLTNRIATDVSKGNGWMSRLMSGPDPETRAMLKNLYPDTPEGRRSLKKLLQEVGTERSASKTRALANVPGWFR